jgi:hypothetical protein
VGKRRDLKSYQKMFPPKCDPCAVKSICDGIDVSYLKDYGDAELKPYPGPPITDVVHFRRQNPAVFLLKQRVGPSGAIERPRIPPKQGGVGARLKRKSQLLRLAVRNTREEMRRGQKIVADLMSRPADAFHTGVVVLRSLLRVTKM